MRVLKLGDLVKFNLSIIRPMYRAFNSSLPQNLQKVVPKKTFHENMITTRQVNKFKQPACRITMRNMSISVRGMKCRNSLDKTLTVKCESLSTFKVGLEKTMLEKYIENT